MKLDGPNRGTAPAGGRTTSVGQVCDQFGGDVQTGPFGSQLHAADYSAEGTPVVMPQDMHEGRIVCDRIARVGQRHAIRLERHTLRTGDIVFSRRGDVTRFALVTEAEAGWLCGTGSIRIRLNSPEVLVGYVRRYLQQEAVGAWLIHHAKGVTMPNLNTSVIRSLPFVYPPLPEQQRIADILDRADALRTKRRSALALLDTLPSSIFIDMFGDFSANRWPTDSLDRCADPIQIGPFGSLLHESDYVQGGVPLVNPKHIHGGTIVPGRTESVGPVKYAELSLYRLRAGDVVMGRRGEMGRCAIVPSEQEGFVCGTGSLFIRPVLGRLTSRYLASVLSSDRMRERLKRLALGITLPNLNRDIVAQLEIQVPPIEIQREFALRVAAVDKLKEAHLASLAQLDALNASLQHRAFRGEL